MRNFFFLFSFLITTTSVIGQTPNRTAPPALGKAKNLQLPEVQKFTMSNGLQVVLMEKHNVPMTQINLVVKTGSFDDPAGKEGLSSFALDVMDEGAGTLNSLELADEIEFLGAQINTLSRNFTSEINCSAPVSKLEPVLKLMSDIALRPSFSENEIERLRKLRLSGLLQNYDDPGVISQRAYNKLLFAENTPYGKFPTESSIRAYTKDDLLSFHKSNFVTGNGVVIVVGDVTKASLLPLLEKYFGAYPKGEGAKANRPAPQQIKGRPIYVIDKPGAAQSVIRIGKIGTTRSDAAYNSIVVMNTILGGSFTSRLNTNLREVHGYAYGAGSNFGFWPVPGPFTAVSSVQTDATGPALGEFFNEFKNINKPLPEDEFNRARNYDALSYAKGFETNANIATGLADMILYNLDANYFNSYVDKALAVAKKDVEGAAKRFVTPENVLVVVVGDRSKIEEGINKLNLGKITFLSVEDILGKKPQL